MITLFRKISRKTSRGKRLRQRGASALEVAFLMGLFVIPTVQTVDYLQNQQGSNLEAGAGRIGSPAENSGFGATGAGNGYNSGNTNTTPTTGIETTLSFSTTTTIATNGKKWSALVVIDPVDNGGAAVSNGTIEGTWTITDDAGLTRTEAGSCVISAGQCTLQISQLSNQNPDKDVSVVFTVSNLDSTDLVLSATTPLDTGVITP